MRNLVESTLHKRYHIERELGKGGMGTVYLAQDLRLQRAVAIKVLPPELAVRADLRERFLRETRLAAAFSHPNIVPVHEVEEHPQLLCFVMGFIEGETLGGRVRRAGPLGAAEAVRLVQEVAWALSYAHGRGVVHRDIKPDNILIERASGRAFVTDFGIARSNTAAGTNLTQVGELVGTPQFMSPEQASGEPLDGRSDLYSLGVVAFFAVTGRLPFEADSAGALMAMHITQPAPRVSSLRPDLPQSLTSAIDRLLEKDPARRFESGEAIASALDPLRASRREISPLVRQFNIEAGTAFRAVLLITLFSSYLSLQGGGDLDVLMPLLIGGGIVWGVAAQMVGRARSLQRTGFSFDEVRAGLRAILDERLEARSLDRADPISRRRESMRRRTMIFAAAAGVYGFVHVFRYMRTKVNEHMYAVNRPGVVLLFASAILVGIALALFMMSPTRSLNVERLIVKIWTGPVGRAVFRLASWRLGATAHRGESSPTSATSGPMLLFASLSGALRRELGDAKSGIEALEQALRALGEKQRGIEEAIADAGTITASTDPALQARRMELVRDLTKARDDAITKRERLAGALENVRVQLLRLKSGVGSASDVSAELRTARGFVG